MLIFAIAKGEASTVANTIAVIFLFINFPPFPPTKCQVG
jgi:hypothetical protein